MSDEIEFKPKKAIARERELEELLLQNDLVLFAGATYVKDVGPDGRRTYKLTVGVEARHAPLVAMMLDSTLRRVSWAEEENVALEAMVVLGRSRPRA